MNTVRSADGTAIAYRSSGSGPPLLLVHGMTASHATTWQHVTSLFETRFTVHAMDRRGRGGSGDSTDYSLQREAEDVAAVIAAVGPRVDVVGHSFGALCSLEAALISPGVRRLVLYEGIPAVGDPMISANLLERLQTFVERDDAEGLLVLLYESAGISASEIEILRSNPEAWETRLANAPTTPREMRALLDWQFEPTRFRDLRTPTLLLVGSESPPIERDNARAVAAALPKAHVEMLSGQAHLAMYSDPARFVAEIEAFLLD